jgi:hypothetical protein
MKAGIDLWEDWDFSCPKCGWSGKGSALGAGDITRTGCEELCPSCNEMIDWLEFPLVAEMLENFDKLKPEDQKMALVISQGHNKWEASKLKSVDQLPDIESDYIVLLWDEDQNADEIMIRHGRDVIFRQQRAWEYFEFFITACRILKTKYGYRLLDVVPTPRAAGSIYGDRCFGPTGEAEMRRLIGLDCWPPNDDTSPGEIEKRLGCKTYLKQYDD